MFKKLSQGDALLVISFLATCALMWWGGLKEAETPAIAELLASLSVTMAGFGMVAFQIARASNTLRHDFLETSILMLLATIFGIFFLVYPNQTLFGFNFGELNLFFFFWSLALALMILVDKRLDLLK